MKAYKQTKLIYSQCQVHNTLIIYFIYYLYSDSKSNLILSTKIHNNLDNYIIMNKNKNIEKCIAVIKWIHTHLYKYKDYHIDIRAQIYRNIHKQSNTHRYMIDTYMHTITLAQLDTHTDTDAHRHTHRQTHTDTHTQTQTDTHTNRHTHTLGINIHKHVHTHTNIHKHSLNQSFLNLWPMFLALFIRKHTE